MIQMWKEILLDILFLSMTGFWREKKVSVSAIFASIQRFYLQYQFSVVDNLDTGRWIQSRYYFRFKIALELPYLK